MSNIESDLNQTIASAVNARIEAQVLEALTSNDLVREHVANALNTQVEDGRYGPKIPFVTKIVRDAIQERTKEVVSEEIAATADVIKAEVRTALSKSVGVIADSLVDGFVDRAAGQYPSIEVRFGTD